MSAFKNDLRLLLELFGRFVGRSHIESGLKSISETGVTGWEKWWQVELAIFLNEQPEISEWDMEHEFEVDRRTSDGDRVYVDIGFTIKSWRGAFLLIELKQNDDFKKCIDQMFKDALKFETLKKQSTSGTHVRNVFVAGIFKKVGVEEFEAYFASCCDEYGFEIDLDEYLYLDIQDTEWNLLLF